MRSAEGAPLRARGMLAWMLLAALSGCDRVQPDPASGEEIETAVNQAEADAADIEARQKRLRDR